MSEKHFAQRFARGGANLLKLTAAGVQAVGKRAIPAFLPTAEVMAVIAMPATYIGVSAVLTHHSR